MQLRRHNSSGGSSTQLKTGTTALSSLVEYLWRYVTCQIPENMTFSVGRSRLIVAPDYTLVTFTLH